MSIDTSNDLPILTSSRVKSFRACPRKHHFEYVLGVRPVQTSHALAFGTLLHTALEAYWTARRPGATKAPLQAAIATLADDADPYDRARLEAMLAGYSVAWDTFECEVLAVEAEFRLPLINPITRHPSRTWQLGGKLDLVLRLPDGRIAVVDHKSTSEGIEAGSQYRRRLTMDGQLSMYWHGCEALGWPVDLAIWDVLRKPSIKPSRATPEADRKYTKTGALYAAQRLADETPDEYRDRCVEAILADPGRNYARVEVTRLEAERDQHSVNVWHLAVAMREARAFGDGVYNPDACLRYGSPCPYLDVCEGTAALDDPTRYRRVDPEHPHEELAASAA